MLTADRPTPLQADSAAQPVFWRCLECSAAMEDVDGETAECVQCGRMYVHRDGVRVLQDRFTGNNQVAAEFYNSDRWERFRFWEQLFLRVQGGIPGARMQILRHLRHWRLGRILEVGVGDGDNVALLPKPAHVTGIDVAIRPLVACAVRHVRRKPLLIQAECEHLPFADETFDAVLCVGGFNYFSDPESALAEMARVVKRDGRVVVADELPELFQWGWGHLVGWPQLDSWLLERYWLGPDFAAMVMRNRLNVSKIACSVLGSFRMHRIWRGLGYCLVGQRL